MQANYNEGKKMKYAEFNNAAAAESFKRDEIKAGRRAIIIKYRADFYEVRSWS